MTKISKFNFTLKWMSTATADYAVLTSATKMPYKFLIGNYNASELAELKHRCNATNMSAIVDCWSLRGGTVRNYLNRTAFTSFFVVYMNAASHVWPLNYHTNYNWLAPFTHSGLIVSLGFRLLSGLVGSAFGLALSGLLVKWRDWDSQVEFHITLFTVRRWSTK